VVIYVSPAEPHRFHHLGVVSSEPEEAGVDFLWSSNMGMVGVQRKQFPGDFLASIHDGRLNREYLQMNNALDVKVLLLEGKGNWTSGGELIEQWGGRDRQRRRQWNRTTHRNYLASIQIIKGITVQQTESMADTEQFLQDFKKWTNKEEHLGLEVRPAAQAASYWANISNRDFQRYLLQSLPIIGPKLAEAILDHLGQIFHLDVTVEELMEVPGIGPGRAQKIYDVFHKLEAKDSDDIYGNCGLDQDKGGWE
jgi:ERCC4-type nuclease